MSSEWKTYKVSVENLDLLLTARSSEEAGMMVADAIIKSELPAKFKLKDKNLKLKITRAKGLGA